MIHPTRKTIASALFILLLAAILAGGLYSNARLAALPTPPPSNDFSRALGPADAAVTIVEYGDFACVTCQAWQRTGIMKRILLKYPEKVRFVWRDYPVITPASPKAAEAAWCAADQGKFWPYHDLLYQQAPALAVSQLKSYAAQLGLDPERFNSCLDSGQHASQVAANTREAANLGFLGTPSFLIGQKKLVGLPSFENLSALIDSNPG